MNKEELLKAIEQKRQAIWPTDTSKMAPTTVPNNLEQGWLNALRWMVSLIKSLPDEQQPSEDLDIDEELKRFFEINNLFVDANDLQTVRHCNGSPVDKRYYFEDIARHFAQWQKEQTINKACEWLNKNVVEYHPRKGELRPIVNSNAFREAMEKEDEQCSTE